MKKPRRIRILWTLVCILGLNPPAPGWCVGASGLSAQFVGLKALGLGNAFVAQADDPSANYFNPAGLAQLDGWQLTMGMTGVDIDTKHHGDGVSESMEKNFPVLPHVFITGKQPATETYPRWGWGLGFTTPFGLATEWSDTGFSKYVATKSDLSALHINPNAAVALSPRLSLGWGLDYLMVADLTSESMVNQALLNGDASADGAQKLSGDGGQWGYNLGVLWKPLPQNMQHTLGLSYRSQFKTHLKGDIELKGLSPSTQANYNFPGDNYSVPFETDITFPQSLIVGYYYAPAGARWTLLFDYEWTDWSVFKETRLDIREDDPTRAALLNAANPMVRDWRDVHALALGSEYIFKNGMGLRLGYAFFTTAVPNKTWDPSVPDSTQHTLANGLGIPWGAVNIDLVYNAILYNKRQIQNTVGATSGASVNGTYVTVVQLFGLGLTYRFH